ncbi:MAG TPA: Na+/H+ antiporter NhaA [Marmoricola sp.]
MSPPPRGLATSLRRVLEGEAGGAGLLLAAAVVALAWANSAWSDSYRSLWSTTASFSFADRHLSMTLGHWVNDGLMALFFFVVGLEVRREFSIGALTTPRRAALPVLAALGGLVVPAALYLLLSPVDANGAWGVVIGTDTAVMLGALAVVGPRLATRLRIFLLTLTVIDDIVAVGVIGVFYSESLDPVGLALVAALATVVAMMSRRGVWTVAPYLVVGIALWLATLQAGLHASIAGMLGGLLVAAHRPHPEVVRSAADRFRAFHQAPSVDVGRSAHRELVRAVSVNERMQRRLHPWANLLVVPLFVLANAGIDLRGGVLADALTSRLTWAITIALVVGKLAGILGATWAGVRTRLTGLPSGVTLGEVAGGAALSGIGFTVSLLVAGLAFTDPVDHDRAVVGILLAAVIATVAGWLAFRLATAPQTEPGASGPEEPARAPVTAAR